MIAAAALCPAPPLLMPEVTGAAEVLPELRAACLAAVAELAAAGAELIALVGTGVRTESWLPGSKARLTDHAPKKGDLVPQYSGSGWPPAPLRIGEWLLDETGYAGDRLLLSVAAGEPAAACAEIGADLDRRPGRVAVLAMGDGSARRGPKAPGYYDERSLPFDAGVERAVRAGDLAALAALDPALADELMVTGRAPWQVLAGALVGVPLATLVRYCDDPYGVAYLVASMRPRAGDKESSNAG
jgi:hypothetical protein